MLVCSKCGLSKEESDFHRRKDSTTGYRRECKRCEKGHKASKEVRNEESKQRYAKNKEKYRVAMTAYKVRLKNHINEYKIERGCIQCGYKDEPEPLEMHHVNPETKTIEPANAGSIKKFNEIAEDCVVLCAICHRLLHANKLELNLKEA